MIRTIAPLLILLASPLMLTAADTPFARLGDAPTLALPLHQRGTTSRPLEKDGKPARKKDSPDGPRNLGPKINSYASELLPVISPDGNTLYFVRDGHKTTEGEEGDQDIWFSVRDRRGQWAEPVHMDAPLNTSMPNGVMSVTPDGNTLLLNGAYDGGPGFSLTHRTPNGWSAPKKLEIRNYYNNSRYVAVYLANDARTLILTIERDDSRGGMDLYMSRRGANGEWSEPRTLGPTVNTRQDENAPCLASDGITLYFASEGRKGEGSADIYMTRRLDESWTKWSEPVNLGPTINTSGFESGFFLPAAGDSAYYCSSISGEGRSDIFRIKLPDFARPKAVVLVSGKVIDRKTKRPVEATIVYETLADGKQVGVARSDPKTGQYRITLPVGATYGFMGEASGYMAVSDNLDLSAVTAYGTRKRDLLLVPIEVGQSARLNNLFFDFSKATLRPESFSELGRLIEVLNNNPTMEIEIAGHTDGVGTASRNLALSQERATAVADYLKEQGIDGNRLVIKGYGATKPVARNNSEENRQLNRRVEVVIRRK